MPPIRLAALQTCLGLDTRAQLLIETCFWYNKCRSFSKRAVIIIEMNQQVRVLGIILEAINRASIRKFISEYHMTKFINSSSDVGKAK